MINFTQWKVTQLAQPLCCVVLDHSISLQTIYAYKAVIYDGITTCFVVFFLWDICLDAHFCLRYVQDASQN